MAFKFNLETLLKHRKRVEEEAQRVYFEAKSKADAALAEIEQMYDKIDEARQRAEALETEGGDVSQYVIQIDQFIMGQKLKIEMKKVIVRELLSEAEEKHELLTEASQEFKIIEKLKENKKAEYLKIKRKKEQKKLDENSVIRFNYKGQEDDKFL
jgi:flagellar protein FliJ